MMAGMPREPLRLAFIADPNSVHTRRWVNWFAAHGHVVHVLDGYGVDIQPGLHQRIQVDRYDALGGTSVPILSLFRGRRSLRRALSRIRPDVLHGHFVRRYGWQAALAGFRPYVITAWGSDILVKSLRTWRVRWWDRFALGRADLITVVSDHMREAVIAAGAPPDRISEVQFGVDTDNFSPGPADPGLSDRLALSGRRIVLSSRAIRPLYRHETVVDAFADLGDDLVLVMTGRGADQAYLASLTERMEAHGVTDRVRIIDDISDEDLPKLYRMAAVVVSVPESDSVALTMLEAMASGTPVVASNLAPVRTVLGDLAPELIVPVGDAAALRTAVQSVLALAEPARRQLGERLRAYVVREADYDGNMALMESLYRQLAER
jgi:glycosyltransferase involved in cell wall biosynthesis